jgi:DHA2 family multidrug resistance protein
VFRLLQGVFGAPLVPLSQSVLLDTYPRERHAQAMAIWGIGVMVGPILGPMLGGWITETYNWRWVFWINLPVGMSRLPRPLDLPRRTRRRRALRFDWFGFTTAQRGDRRAADDARPRRAARLVRLDRDRARGGCARSRLAVRRPHLHRRAPFIDPRMFRDRNLVAGLIVMFMMGSSCSARWRC